MVRGPNTYLELARRSGFSPTNARAALGLILAHRPTLVLRGSGQLPLLQSQYHIVDVQGCKVRDDVVQLCHVRSRHVIEPARD